MKKALNFVYIASAHMRAVEDQLADGIAAALPGWAITRSHLKPAPDALNFTFFISRPADFMMSHGLADKNYLFRREAGGQPAIARYRRVFVPGPWLRERLLRTFAGEIAPEAIVSVGWPRLDALAGVAGDPPPAGARRKVLWAPTLADASAASSYPALMGMIPALRRRYEVAVSVHPADRNGGPTTFEQLRWADVVIADHGTSVYEAWALGKPVVFPTWLVGDKVQQGFPDSAEALLFRQRIGVHAASLTELIDHIDSQNTIGVDVKSFMKDYVVAHDGTTSNQLIAAEIERLHDVDPV